MKKEYPFVVSEKTGKKYYPTIGLEIHAELRTKTKMFCACKNEPFADDVNTNICEICLAHPGTLPYVNKEAVKHMIKLGIAVNGDIADFTEFDRKNYFYPDIPKAYQISQYKYPIVSNGELVGVGIERIHLEEDTATSSHKDDHSLVNFNRAGVPLSELVTTPTIYDAQTAMKFAKEWQLLLRTLGAGEANIEKGEMRIEVNLSISEEGNFEMLNKDFSKLGTKTEMKNLGSFKIVGAVIESEIKRQIELIESGGVVEQETRGWDDIKGETFLQRKKENSADYRYFPDPDIPKFKLSEIEEFSIEKLKEELPELPWIRRERYLKDYKIQEDDVEFYLQNKFYGELFDKAVLNFSTEKEFKLLSNYISSDLAGFEKTDKYSGNLENINSDNITELIKMIIDGDLSSRGAKDTLIKMYENGGNAKEIAEKNNLIQKSNVDELLVIVKDIIENNKPQVEQYKGGNEKLLMYFVGQGMKATKGSANPGLLSKIFKEELEK